MSQFEVLFGGTPGVFLGITVFFMGGCAFMTGQALASRWKPAWHAVPYGLLLACADRFLDFALFDGRLSSLSGYLLDGAVLVGIGLLAHRLTLARQMATQYPWIYERTGPFTWRERAHR